MKKIGVGIGRLVAYVCAAVLILSLPTFSLIVPTSRWHSDGSSYVHNRLPNLFSQELKRSSVFVTPTPAAAVLRTNVEKRGAAEPAGGNVQGANALHDPEEALGFPAFQIRARHGGESVYTVGGFRHRPDNELAGEAFAETAREHAGISQELSLLDEGYEAALGNLFGKFSLRILGLQSNPFQGALQERTENPPPDAAQKSVPDPAKETTVSVPGPSAAARVAPELRSEERFSFLIMGQFFEGRNGQKIFRARLRENGAFFMEGLGEWTFYPYLGGVLSFEDRTQVVSGDRDGDALLDFATSKDTIYGSQFDLFVRDTQKNQFVPESQMFFRDRQVVSFAFFDLQGDKNKELFIVFADLPQISVYEYSAEGYRHLKDWVFSFKPALVLSVVEGVLQEEKLFVFDDSLSTVVMLSSRNRDNFLILDGFGTTRKFMLSFSEPLASPEELLVLERANRIAIVGKSAVGLRVFGSFDAGRGYPFVIVGDYFQKGRPQIIYAPGM